MIFLALSLLLSSLVIFSFRFFSFILLCEYVIITIVVYLVSAGVTTIFVVLLLVLGACEVGLALSLLVSTVRMSGLEKSMKMKCEGF